MSPSGSGDAFQRFVAMVALGGSTSTLHPIFQSHGFNPCSSTPTRCHVPKISSTSCSLENSKSNLVLDGRAPRGSRFAKNLQGRGLRIVNDYGRFDSVRQSGDSKRGRKSVGSSRTVDGESSRQERSGSSNAGDESSSRSNGGRGRASQEVDSSSSSSGVALAAHVDVITSVGNAYVKHLVKVRQTPSYRNAAGCVVVVGSVPLREICELITKENPEVRKPLKVFLVLEDSTPQLNLRSWAERIIFVTEPVMKKVAGVDSTQGLKGVGVLSLPTSFRNLEANEDLETHWIPSPRRVLVLDGIQDPGNLGTLLRTAAAFNWDGVFLLPSCCDPFNEKALRASRGAAFRIPIASGHWPQIQVFAELQHLKLYAADPEQEHVEQKCGMDLESHVMHDPPVRFDTSKTVSSDSERPQDFDEMSHSSGSTGNRVESISSERTLVGKAPSHRKDSIVSVAEEKALCLVLGSEGQGLSETVRQSCKQLSIHMPGDFESLNVAVAGNYSKVRSTGNFWNLSMAVGLQRTLTTETEGKW